jgi:hypothetical protein
LVVLEVLAEASAPIYDDELIALYLDRGFSNARSVENAIDEVVGCGLAAGLASDQWVDKMDVISPWQGSCAPLLELVQGITLPAQPPDPAVRPDDGLREVLAVAGLTAPPARSLHAAGRATPLWRTTPRARRFPGDGERRTQPPHRPPRLQ